jgi:hypothetical protein
MRDPSLFWSSLASLPFAGVCFLFALRVTSPARALTLQIGAQVIAGTAAILMGYESAFRTAARSTRELQINTSVGLFFLAIGLFSVADAVVKALNK